jgi:hypothetical protein
VSHLQIRIICHSPKTAKHQIARNANIHCRQAKNQDGPGDRGKKHPGTMEIGSIICSPTTITTKKSDLAIFYDPMNPKLVVICRNLCKYLLGKGL